MGEVMYDIGMMRGIGRTRSGQSHLARKIVYWFIGDTGFRGTVENHFPQREEKKKGPHQGGWSGMH